MIGRMWQILGGNGRGCCISVVRLSAQAGVGVADFDLRALAAELEALVIRAVDERIAPFTSFHYDRLAELAASLDSARFALEFFGGVPRFDNDEAMMRAACRAAPADGLVLEFGVASGRSIAWIGQERAAQTVYGFDSFEGLPEDWRPGFGAGTFAQAPPAVPKNVELVVGWFNATLPGFVAAHPGPVALLHVDCDLYSSTVTILEALADRIVPGTVIVFDEFLNYPGWPQHEVRAWNEFVARTGIKYRYAGCVPSHQQVMVVIL